MAPCVYCIPPLFNYKISLSLFSLRLSAVYNSLMAVIAVFHDSSCLPQRIVPYRKIAVIYLVVVDNDS